MSTVRLFPVEPEKPALRISIAWGIGLALLAEAFGASVVLVMQHLRGLQLPGCGPQSACAQLAAGALGHIGPFPLSAIGAAWFAALIIGWLMAFRGATAALRWTMRFSVVASLFYLGAMAWSGQLCPYCLAVHVANLLAWLCAEWLPAAAPATASPARSGAVLAGVFALTLAGLWLFEQSQEKQLAARSAEQISQSIDQIAGNDAKDMKAPSTDAKPASDASAPLTSEAGKTQAAGNEAATPSTETVAEPATADVVPESPNGVESLPVSGFTGRYRRGPESARVRLVIWADYECEDCQTLEKLLSAIVSGRDDVSLSLKHFPFCEDCNPKATYNRHPNACRAAQAVEAAGVLGGEKIYWAMADWMLEHGAGVAEEDIVAQAVRLGLDPKQFEEARTGPEVTGRIAADIDEAMRYGLDRTPFIFINGVELRGWRTPQQVEQAVLAVAAKDLPPKTAEADIPRLGAEKYFQLWRKAQEINIPASNEGWPLGRSGNGPRIVWFGEHQAPQSVAASNALLAALKKYPNARLEFRHFPLSKRGNPLLKDRKVDSFPLSYDMALLAQAAGRLSGQGAFWKMHRWLIEHQDEIDAQSLARAAEELNLDPLALQRKLAEPATAAAVAADVQLAAKLGVRQAPTVAIDGRPVDGLVSNPEVIERILEELAGQ